MRSPSPSAWRRRDEAPPERLVLPGGFLAFVRVLAARGPVLLAIDDVQWLDAPSQRIVAYACNRLVQAPVGILAAHRGDVGDTLGLRHALDDRFAEMRVPPLGDGAMHDLVRSRLGVRIPRATMARVQAASGGNAMFALEFAQVAATADGPLPLPSSLEELIGDRVAALPARAPTAAGGGGCRRATTLSRLEMVIEDTEELVHAASAAAALSVGLRRRCRFMHPLLASAAYAAASPSSDGSPRKPRILEPGFGGTRATRRAVDLQPGCGRGTAARRGGGTRRSRGVPGRGGNSRTARACDRLLASPGMRNAHSRSLATS